MFLHNFKYTLKCLFGKKALVFWTIIFPLALATFFNMAFGDIEKDDKLNVFSIAIVDNDSFNNTDLTSPSQEPSIPSIDIESEENEPA